LNGVDYSRFHPVKSIFEDLYAECFAVALQHLACKPIAIRFALYLSGSSRVCCIPSAEKAHDPPLFIATTARS
jgi:hypothetical protein